jgi:hypothetical protein
LNAGGEAAVAEAWRGIAAELGGGRVSERAVREALERQGVVTVAPKRAYGTPLQPVERSIERALVRARELRAAHAGRGVPVSVRDRAVLLAGWARELAEELEAVADVRVAEARLAAVEAPVLEGVELPAGARPGLAPGEPFGDGCLLHGSRRDPSGRCAWCGQRDVAA